MKKIISFLLIMLMFTSCITERKRMQIYENCPVKIVEKDSSTAFITIKDTIYKVQAPADTIVITEHITSKDTINIQPKEVRSGIITARAWVQNNTLHLMAWTNDTKILVPVERISTERVKFIYKDVVKHLPSEIKKVIPWYIYIIIGALILALLYLLFKNITSIKNIIPFRNIFK